MPSDDAGTLLAYYGQSSTVSGDAHDLPICPSRSDFVLVGLRTGLTVPARCGKLRCPVCIVIEARNLAAAIALAAPERAILLSARAGQTSCWSAFALDSRCPPAAASCAARSAS